MGPVAGASNHRICSDPVRINTSFLKSLADFGHNCIFAFTSAEYVLYACGVADDNGNLLEDLAESELRSQVRVIGGSSLVVSTIVYVLIGLSGATAFGHCAQEDVLL